MQSQEQMAAQLHSVRDMIRWAVTRFSRAGLYFGHGTDNAVDEALQLILHTLGLPAGSESLVLDGRLLQEEKLQLLELIECRVHERVPLPYLIGEANFAGLLFNVDERVLIPRSPLAELIEQGYSPWLGEGSVERILDLCTGSGCIGIASAHYFEEADVDLADISSGALEIATSNIERYELQHRVKAIQSDLFAELEGRYHLIVSNPPYVDQEDFSSMPAEYQHEPALALASGDDGLDITRRILREAENYLTEQGVLIVEVGNSCMALEEAFPNVPFTWLEFEHGGHGVFVFNREELQRYKQAFI